MLQKPDLADDRVVSCLRESYGLTVAELEFLPIGNDNSAWAYRAGARDGTSYFLKVRKGPVDEVSVRVPRRLVAAGVWRVVAPISTMAGEKPWGSVDGYALLVYPFIEGQSARLRSLTDAQWVEYGRALRAIHQARLCDEVLRRVPREAFVSAWASGARRLQALLAERDCRDPYARELAAIWKERRDQVTQVLRRTEALGRQLRDRRCEVTVCHTDPHAANLLVDLGGRLWVVDWDAPLLAPKERDLHFVVSPSVVATPIGPREEALIFQGYGPTAIDWPALTYFRYEWVCGDLLGYGERVLAHTEFGEATREDAIHRVRRMFEPGSSVASAFELEQRQPH